MSLEQLLERRPKLVPTKEHANFYQRFYEENLAKHFEAIVEEMRKKIDSKKCYILPSFFNLLTHLSETNRRCKLNFPAYVLLFL